MALDSTWLPRLWLGPLWNVWLGLFFPLPQCPSCYPSLCRPTLLLCFRRNALLGLCSQARTFFHINHGNPGLHFQSPCGHGPRCFKKQMNICTIVISFHCLNMFMIFPYSYLMRWRNVFHLSRYCLSSHRLLPFFLLWTYHLLKLLIITRWVRFSCQFLTS